jgi:lauroyl/myristoyl acyltransferase
MADRHSVTMLMLHFGTPRDQEARAQLAAALPVVEADDLEQALRRVWDAVAASGTDDHIVFLEHPDLPEHWRRFSARP